MDLLLHNIEYLISLQENYSQKLLQEGKNNTFVSMQIKVLNQLKNQALKLSKDFDFLNQHFATDEEKSILQALHNTTVFTSNNELRGELYKIIYHSDIVNADFRIWKEQKQNDRQFVLSLFEILEYNPDNIVRMKELLKSFAFNENIYLALWKQTQTQKK